MFHPPVFLCSCLSAPEARRHDALPEHVVLRPVRSIWNISRIFPVLARLSPGGSDLFLTRREFLGRTTQTSKPKPGQGHQCCFPQCGARAKEADTAGKESCPAVPRVSSCLLSWPGAGPPGPYRPQERRVARDVHWQRCRVAPDRIISCFPLML
jgi:hypothetical protein